MNPDTTLRSAVTALIEAGTTDPAAIHAALWPTISALAAELGAHADLSSAPTTRRTDQRAKPWQYVVRFWLQGETGPELVAETDLSVMYGTGELPRIVSRLAAQLHVCMVDELPDELQEAGVKDRLPQLRNNLGRQASAALRIPYKYADLDDDGAGGRVFAYTCQVDVYRLGA